MARPPGPFRRFVARHSPTRAQLVESRWLRPVRRYIAGTEFWRFTRRSVPRAVAIGVFIGTFLMVPGVQMIAAAALSIPLRANIAVAAAVTWISNPITTPLFLVAGLEVGSFLGFESDMAVFMDLVNSRASLGEWMGWMLSDAAPAMAVGLGLLGLAGALVAYLGALVGWRLWIARRWRQRTLDNDIRVFQSGVE